MDKAEALKKWRDLISEAQQQEPMQYIDRREFLWFMDRLNAIIDPKEEPKHCPDCMEFAYKHGHHKWPENCKGWCELEKLMSIIADTKADSVKDFEHKIDESGMTFQPPKGSLLEKQAIENYDEYEKILEEEFQKNKELWSKAFTDMYTKGIGIVELSSSNVDTKADRVQDSEHKEPISSEKYAEKEPKDDGWISFADQMPKHNQNICVRSENLWHGEGIFQDGKFVYSWVKGACFGNPTHWKPQKKDDGWKPWPPENWNDIKDGSFQITENPQTFAWIPYKLQMGEIYQFSFPEKCNLKKMKFWRQDGC